MGKPCSCTQFIKSYYISHGYPYQYYKSCESLYQVLPVKCTASKHAMKSKVHMIITIDLCSINHNCVRCSGRLHITFKPASLQGDKVCLLFIHIHVDAKQLDSSVFTVESGTRLTSPPGLAHHWQRSFLFPYALSWKHLPTNYKSSSQDYTSGLTGACWVLRQLLLCCVCYCKHKRIRRMLH